MSAAQGKKPTRREACPVCSFRIAVRGNGRLYPHDRQTETGRVDCLGSDSVAGDAALAARAPLYRAADDAARRLKRAERAVAVARETIAREEPRLPDLCKAQIATAMALAVHDAAIGGAA